MKKVILVSFAVSVLALASGCGSSAPKDQGNSADKAAAAMPPENKPAPPAASTPQGDPETGTGSAGIRSVPPTQEGDRN